MRFKHGFTLIELLVVIAIIAILSIVVVLTLNPAALLQQSRDANRVSDLATMNSALGIYSEDVGTPLGSASTTYISIPDPIATSTLGDQCQGLGLPSLPAGFSYHCASSSTFRNTDTSGWLPVKLSSVSIGNPISILSIDPTNTTSTNLYYSYNTNGTQYQLNAHFESQKYIPLEAQSGSLDPATYSIGNNLAIAPWNDGMIGFWPLNEGTGTIAYDRSGFGNNGTWSGTATGTNGTYYAPGYNQAYAGDFDGSSTYISITSIPTSSQYTASLWINPVSLPSQATVVHAGNSIYRIITNSSGCVAVSGGAVQSSNCLILINGWYNLATSYDGATSKIYVNGILVASAAASLSPPSGGVGIGAQTTGYQEFPGLISNVRIYNRVLSPTEIAAIYSAGR